MSKQEFYDEIKLDFQNVFDIADAKDAKVQRLIKTSKLFPLYLHSFITTKRKNRWLILWEAKSKKYIGENELITFICLQNTSHGKYAHLTCLYNGMFLILTFPPHFFSRFSERMKNDLTGEDLIQRYFQQNASYGFKYQKTKIGDNYVKEVYGSSKEGVAMGVCIADVDIYLFKTFITYEMSKGSQIEDFAKNENLRREIHDKEMTL